MPTDIDTGIYRGWYLSTASPAWRQSPYDRLREALRKNVINFEQPIWQTKYLTEEGISMKNPFEGIKEGDNVKVTYYGTDAKIEGFTSTVTGTVEKIESGFFGHPILHVGYSDRYAAKVINQSVVKKIKVIEKALPKVGDKITKAKDLERLPAYSVVSRGHAQLVWKKDFTHIWRAPQSSALDSRSLINVGDDFLVVLRVGGELS